MSPNSLLLCMATLCIINTIADLCSVASHYFANLHILYGGCYYMLHYTWMFFVLLLFCVMFTIISMLLLLLPLSFNCCLHVTMCLSPNLSLLWFFQRTAFKTNRQCYLKNAITMQTDTLSKTLTSISTYKRKHILIGIKYWQNNGQFRKTDF